MIKLFKQQSQFPVQYIFFAIQLTLSRNSDGTPNLIFIFMFGRPPGTMSAMQGIELNSIALRQALTAALVAPSPDLMSVLNTQQAK
jgi:hypothetical protein